MKIITLLIIISILLLGPASASSTRSLGMGDLFSPASRDPSGIFYNPAFLARADSIRLSFDNIYADTLPRNNIAFSIGDLGIARSSTLSGPVYSFAHGFNTYSFLRLGVGVKFLEQKKDFDIGLDADITKNIGLSAALLNDEGNFLPRKTNIALAYYTEDRDKLIAINSDLSGNIGVGYEQQITSKAFVRAGYNVDHLTAGLTFPIDRNIDIDLALDSSRVLLGISLFRNTENKRKNSNHSINFGKAIVGSDKWMNIEGYDIHYTDAGQGFPLVLVGGGIHYTHHWDPYVKELAKHYRVISIDHIGAGESDKPDYFFGYTIEEQGEIIHELLNRLDIKECNIWGYCYGGSIAFYLGGQYPERYKKIVNIEGFVRGINTIPIADRGKDRSGSLKMRHDVEFLGAYGLRDIVTFKYRLDYPYFNGKMWYQLNKAVLYSDFREKIKNLKAPVLYFAGTKSWAYDFLGPTKEYLKDNIKDLTYEEWDGAGHDVDRFDQKKFMEEVLGFLAK